MRYVCPQCGDGGDAEPCPADGTMREPVGADALLGTTIGSWRVARLLGAGGMGKVYVAVQPAIGARVAIKVLKRESAADPEVVERFFNEARAVNLIKHEAIVDVIDLGRLPEGAPYIVMEYLDGASLGALVRRDKQLPLGTLARIIGEVLAALEAVHGKSIIHRDLKPDNVVVSPGGRVTVLDFGIAKLATVEGLVATQTGSLLGTPAYMSPEQARTQPLDARSDLYSIGVILYEAATGQLPFVAQNLFDLLQMHVEKPPRPPRDLVPDIPAAYEAVILRALAKDPANRFASAAAMREALVAAAAGLPQPSLTIVAEAPGKAQKSDPLADTASDSIATDKTLPSSPRVVQPAPAPRRTLLYAVMGSVAVVGLGGAALWIDNAKPPRAAYAEDAGVHAARVDAPPLAFPESGLLPLAHPEAFDPIEAYGMVSARAEQLGGPSTRLNAMLLRHMDQRGIVDLTKGSVELVFTAPELAKAGKECYMIFDFDQTGGRLSRGSETREGDCAGAVFAPRCALTEIVKRSLAKGMPADASNIILNKFRDSWLVSAGDWSEPIDDDCE